MFVTPIINVFTSIVYFNGHFLSKPPLSNSGLWASEARFGQLCF